MVRPPVFYSGAGAGSMAIGTEPSITRSWVSYEAPVCHRLLPCRTMSGRVGWSARDQSPVLHWRPCSEEPGAAETFPKAGSAAEEPPCSRQDASGGSTGHPKDTPSPPSVPCVTPPKLVKKQNTIYPTFSSISTSVTSFLQLGLPKTRGHSQLLPFPLSPHPSVIQFGSHSYIGGFRLFS